VKRTAKVFFEVDELAARLGLADDVEIIDVVVSRDPLRVNVMVESGRLPPVAPHAEAPYIPLRAVAVGRQTGDPS
jgi:hypothetical protein